MFATKAKTYLKRVGEYLFLALIFYTLVVNQITTIIEFPFYLSIHLYLGFAWVLFWFSLAFIGIDIIFGIIRRESATQIKKSIKRNLNQIKKRLHDRKTRPFMICLLLYLVINLSYPLFLASSKSFTGRVITEGVVVAKSEKIFHWYAGRLATRRDIYILEIEIKGEDGKTLNFDLARYKDKWNQINVGDIIRIKHYPLIRDVELDVSFWREVVI